ncbi:aldehyde dehydrogenase [Bradyrhizobium jicamae]|uniref:aldehyde dehydrogenase n=1 Tax=Bradyrhizobium jicamae TaxID=280332 RepID=UPI001BAA9EC6|nr:aldehyde dehydrogenase [Bradyrhizobium jicamae]MBR0755276.1 aldehyde dehydrogenase [Bradyrhizobium jicamae]
MESSLVIDNRDETASDGSVFERRDPNSGAVVTRAAAASLEDVHRAVQSAAAAFPRWAKFAPGGRRDILLKASALLADRGTELQRIMTAETGASKPWSSFNVRLAAGMLREAASLTTQIKGEIIPTDKPGSFSFAVRRPAGVVLSIAPWNAPIILAVRAFATAIACGNAVILKASEISPGTQYLLAGIMRDAGLPPGVLNFITNAPAEAGRVVEALIAAPEVRRVNFTGSTKTGRIVAEIAARYLKPALLELGGKAPLLVLKDADIDDAVRAAAFGAYIHQGQVCMSTERIVIDEAIAEEFAAKLAAKAKTIVAGNPHVSDVPLGSLISADSAGRVGALVNDAVSKGAKLLAGGRIDGPVMDATLLDHVTPDMQIYSEESFGPVACIVRVRDTGQAIHVANDTEYGLSCGIFTRDVKLAMEIAERLNFGCCHINGPTVHDEPQVPLGGMKASGYGRFGGQPGVNEFTEVQWITIEDPKQHYPI